MSGSYELKNVKCINSPSITQKCIPVDYACASCWQVEWQRCSGTGRGYENASTYEAALNIAKDRIKNIESCKGFQGLDYNNYLIFISGGDYCKMNGPANNSNNTLHNGSNDSQPSIDVPANNKGLNTHYKKENDQLKTNFYTISYTKALSKLNELKLANPEKAGENENNFGAKIRYYEQKFLSEFNKGANANTPLLRQYTQELDNLIETMGLILGMDKQPNNNNQRLQYNDNANTTNVNADNKNANTKMLEQVQQTNDNTINIIRSNNTSTNTMTENVTLLAENLATLFRKKTYTYTPTEKSYTDYIPETPSVSFQTISEGLGQLLKLFKDHHSFLRMDKNLYWVSDVDSLSIKDSVLTISTHFYKYKRKSYDHEYDAYHINLFDSRVAVEKIYLDM